MKNLLALFACLLLCLLPSCGEANEPVAVVGQVELVELEYSWGEWYSPDDQGWTGFMWVDADLGRDFKSHPLSVMACGSRSDTTDELDRCIAALSYAFVDEDSTNPTSEVGMFLFFPSYWETLMVDDGTLRIRYWAQLN